MSKSIEKLDLMIELIREDLLKGCQYASIFITWCYERNKNEKKMQEWFLLYQKLFHSRRLFRVLSCIVYLPTIRDLTKDLKREFAMKSTFALLGIFEYI